VLYAITVAKLILRYLADLYQLIESTIESSKYSIVFLLLLPIKQKEEKNKFSMMRVYLLLDLDEAIDVVVIVTLRYAHIDNLDKITLIEKNHDNPSISYN
jgi:hypothetical protein